MSSLIGQTAGKVWQFLEENGAATPSKIQKGVGADAALTNQALGWLAREGKVRVERSTRATRFSLAE